VQKLQAALLPKVHRNGLIVHAIQEMVWFQCRRAGEVWLFDIDFVQPLRGETVLSIYCVNLVFARLFPSVIVGGIGGDLQRKSQANAMDVACAALVEDIEIDRFRLVKHAVVVHVPFVIVLDFEDDIAVVFGELSPTEIGVDFGGEVRDVAHVLVHGCYAGVEVVDVVVMIGGRFVCLEDNERDCDVDEDEQEYQVEVFVSNENSQNEHGPVEGEVEQW